MSLAIIIPFRNREEHLAQFIERVPEHVKREFKIYVIEQTDEKPFNRAKLMNIGFHLTKDLHTNFCFHDVDLIPKVSDYSETDKPVHLAAIVEQFGWVLAYERCFGGVNIFDKESFIKINGFSNEFWGWGGEDDDLLNRIEAKGYKLNRRMCSYYSLPHHRTDNQHPNYGDNVQKLQTKYDFQTEGLNTLEYTVVKEEQINEFTKKITVTV